MNLCNKQTFISSNNLWSSGSYTMTPAELLQALLDSRIHLPPTQAKNSASPTRIRVLRALRTREYSVSEVAKQLHITRQTAYQAIKPSQEAGLVREVDAGYTLSCSGAALLDVYDRFEDQVIADSLSRLSRSEHQRWILRALREQPERKATLATRAVAEDGPSRTTIHRIIDALRDCGYVTESRGSYELTDTGRRLLEAYEELRITADQAIEKRAFLRWLPADIEGFPVSALAEATVIHNTPDQPHNVLNTFMSAADSGLETFCGMTTIMSPALNQAHQPILAGETTVTLVFTENVLGQLHQDTKFVDYVVSEDYGSYLEGGVAPQNVNISFVRESSPLHIGIYDNDRVIMAPASSADVPEIETAAVCSADPRLVDWTIQCFKKYQVSGRPPLQVFRDQIEAQKSSSDPAFKHASAHE
jgi:predicted transcriptional regulator